MDNELSNNDRSRNKSYERLLVCTCMSNMEMNFVRLLYRMLSKKSNMDYIQYE